MAGATGCGKTTQLPQFLLDDAVECGAGAATRVLVTQPRRVAATSVAARVAAERGETLAAGGAGAGAVGYKARRRAPGRGLALQARRYESGSYSF